MPHKSFIIGSGPDILTNEDGKTRFFVKEDGRCFVSGVNNEKHAFMRQVSIDLFDIDGTVMELLHDPATRRIDESFLAGVRLKNEFYPDTAIAITGRDRKQVVQVMGGVQPFFPVISSNGADLCLPNGVRHSYPFSQKERNFIACAKKTMRTLGREFPYLVTEIKDWSIGFHTAAKQDYAQKYGITPDKLADMVASASNVVLPVLLQLETEAETLKLNFILGGAEATNRELYHGTINKAEAISRYAPYLQTLPKTTDWSYVNFFGDSLFGHGNDREMARITRQNGGSVIMITNGKSRHLHESITDSEPHFGFSSPRELGEVYYHRVRHSIVRDFGIEALRKALVKHDLKLVI